MRVRPFLLSKNMPYSSISDLPDSIRKLPEQKQKQFLEVFNSAYEKCKADGVEDCDATAFAQAHGVVGKAILEEYDLAFTEAKAGARHSRKDSGMVQTIHDHAVSLGASCGEGKTVITHTISAATTDTPNGTGATSAAGVPVTPTDNGNHLKAISETETEYRVANRIILFGGKDLEGIASPNKNADGSTGEYFSKATDFESTYTQTGMLYVDWEHGRDDLSQDDLLGYVDWKSAKVDDKGLWVERVLNRRNKYVQWLKTLIDSGLVGTSSEPVQSRIAKAADGHITRWPLKRDTLTVTPMEPRMLNENALAALKALAGEVPCVKNACLKSGLLSNDLGTKETELSIQANLAYINSVLEEV